MLRQSTAEERQNWDDLVWRNAGGPTFYQLSSYADFKQPVWQPHYLVHDFGADGVFPTLYLYRSAPPFGELWFCPTGPSVPNVELFRRCCEDLRHDRRPFAVMLEPPIPAAGPEVREELIAAIPGAEDVLNLSQGQHTVFIDLSKSEEELLKSFRQRTRRAIRQSANAVIEIHTDHTVFEQMWHLYDQTARRANVALRSKEYHQGMWTRYLADGMGFFVMCRPEAGLDYEAGAFILCHHELGYYKDGGSLRTDRSNGLQYAVQWEAMKECKRRGATVYDMFGAPPSWKADDKSHRMYPLVQFKTGFAPISDHVGTIRLVIKPNAVKWWDKYGQPLYYRLTKNANPLFY